jgi:peptidyl-prolyl cis-trans isomerase A (cyclophilin A)
MDGRGFAVGQDWSSLRGGMMKLNHRPLKLKTLLLPMALCTAVGAAQTPTTAPPAELPDAPSTTAHVAPPPEPSGPTVVFDTTMGRLTCKLFSKEAPQTTASFIGLATGSKSWTDPVTLKPVAGKPFYDGTTFHRVIPGFMIQGGDRLGDGTGDAGFYLPDEVSPALRFDVPGRLAMANSGPGTDGSQFFITEDEKPELNGHYTIFGQCDTHSVLLAASIARVERDRQDTPVTPVVLNKVTVVSEGQPLPPLPPAAAPAAASSDPAAVHP